MTIEQKVKADFAAKGITPSSHVLWEAICAAICGAPKERPKRKEGRRPRDDD